MECDEALPDCGIVALFQHTRPVHRHNLDFDADLAEILSGNQGRLIDEVVLLAGNDAERLALVAGFRQELLRLGDAFLVEETGTGLRLEWRRRTIEPGMD